MMNDIMRDDQSGGKPEPSRLTCQWCGSKFTPRKTGGRPQKFCSNSCRVAFFSAARKFAVDALEDGRITLDELKGA